MGRISPRSSPLGDALRVSKQTHVAASSAWLPDVVETTVRERERACVVAARHRRIVQFDVLRREHKLFDVVAGLAGAALVDHEAGYVAKSLGQARALVLVSRWFADAESRRQLHQGVAPGLAQ